jgi:hypothetical protein
VRRPPAASHFLEVDYEAVVDDLAAGAMKLRFERAMAGPFGRRQRFVEDRDGAVGIARSGFRFSQRNLQQSVERQNILLAPQFDAAAHLLEPAAGPSAPGRREALKKNRSRSPRRQIMLARESGEFEDARRGAPEVAASRSRMGGSRW